MQKKLDPEILKEIQKRLEKGENLWRLLDQYDFSIDQKIEILRLFDEQKWD